MDDKLSVKAGLNPGRNGSFEVTVDGRLIFSKLSEGRFPENEEIISLLKSD